MLRGWDRERREQRGDSAGTEAEDKGSGGGREGGKMDSNQRCVDA